MNKKIATTIILILAVGMVLFFTLQSSEGTTSLSEAVRHWLMDCGIKIDSHSLRSNIHFLEYFILSLAVIGFGKNRNWKIITCVFISCMIGLVDEGIKVLLPTREFDLVDLVKDWAGVGLAAALLGFLNINVKER